MAKVELRCPICGEVFEVTSKGYFAEATDGSAAGDMIFEVANDITVGRPIFTVVACPKCKAERGLVVLKETDNEEHSPIVIKQISTEDAEKILAM